MSMGTTLNRFKFNQLKDVILESRLSPNEFFTIALYNQITEEWVCFKEYPESDINGLIEDCLNLNLKNELVNIMLCGYTENPDTDETDRFTITLEELSWK